MFRKAIQWSPVELEYLKSHLDDARDQLCIALSKSRSALDKKIKELKTGVVSSSKKKTGIQSKVGRREDLGLYMRSGWEANLMRILRAGLLEYKSPEYEPEIFSFTDWVAPKGPALSYTPDFRVKKGKSIYYMEVKGNWLRAADRTKLRRWFKYYPDKAKNLIAITSSATSKTTEFFKSLGVDKFIYYNELKKQFSKQIPNWE